MAIRPKLILYLALIAVAGCSPLAPRRNYAKFLILTPIAYASTSTPFASLTVRSQIALGVGPIDFPGYLQRTQVVTRSAPTQIDLSPVYRWAEPLDKNFKRVLSENLAQLLNTYRIEEYPWNHETQLDYQIAIQVQNFETTSGGQSELRARWIIKDGTNGRDLYASETTANTTVGSGDAGVSAALSSDLATLSRAIASHVTGLSQQRAASCESGAVLARCVP